MYQNLVVILIWLEWLLYNLFAFTWKCVVLWVLVYLVTHQILGLDNIPEVFMASGELNAE